MQQLISAVRNKYRWDTPNGALSVEHLWDLPLKSTKGLDLDDIAVQLHKELEQNELSFVDNEKPSSARQVLQDKFDIVLNIIETKKKEAELARTAKERAEARARVQELIAQKLDEKDRSASIEELMAKLETLSN